jgi:glycosyltransferase-like protein
MTAPVLMICHSTRPRGGLIHTLSLGEALIAQGVDVRLVALGDPAAGLFRPTSLPHTIVAAPPPAEELTQRVFDAVDSLEAALGALCPAGDVILHAQDCIAARAACRIRDGRARALTGPRPGTAVVRTVHHVDDFTTPALIECQLRAILDPDRVVVVSDHWRARLAAEYGVDAAVVRNGVDPDRFGAATPGGRERFRAMAGADADTFLVLTVGGIEPRKGSVTLLEATADLVARADGSGPRPVLAVVGGHTFFDYRAYRDNALARLPELGLVEGRDILLLGTVSEADLGGWYRAADAFAFPSVKEGFGLVVLEALAAGLPVVASDIPVFAEYLEDGRNALLVPPGDAGALGGALDRLAGDPALRRRLADGGRPLLDRFTWGAAAHAHRDLYAHSEDARVEGLR